MTRTLRPFLLLLALAAFARPAPCQQSPPPSAPPADLKSLLSGARAPLTVKLGALNGGWRRLSVGLSTDNAHVNVAIAPPVNGLPVLLISVGDVYYTKGDTVTLGVDQFLVAYHVAAPGVDNPALQRNGNDPPLPPKLTPDTPLTLALLNLHGVSSLSDIRPFDLTREVAASDQAARQGDADRADSDLKQLGLAIRQYIEDNDEKLPAMPDPATVKKAIFAYVKSDDVFVDPVTHAPFLPNASLSRRTLASFHGPASMVLYYQAAPAPDGTRAVLFMDGHVKRFPEADWPRLKAASHVPNIPVPASLPAGG